MISDISVNSSTISDDDNNSTTNSPLTISTKSETSYQTPHPYTQPQNQNQFYPTSLYASFPYLYFAAAPYTHPMEDDSNATSTSKRMRYDSSYLYPPTYFSPYVLYPPPYNSSCPVDTTSLAVSSPTPTEDSLDSSLSERVEDEAEVWKDVLVFYCGDTSMVTGEIDDSTTDSLLHDSEDDDVNEDIIIEVGDVTEEEEDCTTAALNHPQ